MGVVSFYIRKGSSSIYCSVSYAGIRERISVGEKCIPSQWSTSKEEVKGTGDRCADINDKLYAIKKDVMSYLGQCKEEFSTPDSTHIKRLVCRGEYVLDKTKPLSVLMEEFIQSTKNGDRMTSQGKTITKGTIDGYQYTFLIVKDYLSYYKLPDKVDSLKGDFPGRWQRWQWDIKEYYDNYVGRNARVYNAFIKWLHAKGYIAEPLTKAQDWKEDIDMVVLYPKELSELIKWDAKGYEDTRDAFILGCMTCLRVSNLLSLTSQNIIRTGADVSIKVTSVKTNKPILVKLNQVGIDIINRYENAGVLFNISDQRFNKRLKLMAKAFSDHLHKDSQVNSWGAFTRTRYRCGRPVKETSQFINMISSHTMRRTGATNLLMQGVPVVDVSVIGGWVIGSKELARYVKMSEEHLGKRVVNAWDNIIKQKSPRSEA